MTKIIRFLLGFAGLVFVAALVFGIFFEAARDGSEFAAIVLFMMFAIGLVQAMKFFWPLIISQVSEAGESPREKAKHTSHHSPEDARLSLLLALMTPAERGELKARLVDEIDADEDALPLANLLAEQQNDLQ